MKDSQEIKLTVESGSFYNWLGLQFNDLVGAKEFYRKWRRSQVCCYGNFTLRAMAYHISNVLEGKVDESPGLSNYIDTRYGSEIFFS